MAVEGFLFALSKVRSDVKKVQHTKYMHASAPTI